MDFDIEADKETGVNIRFLVKELEKKCHYAVESGLHINVEINYITYADGKRFPIFDVNVSRPV